MRRPVLIMLILLALGALLALLRPRQHPAPALQAPRSDDGAWVDNTPTTEIPVLRAPSTTVTISGTLDDVL
ncbi:hypothetical protein [Actinokineospora pegani]|uniref:hypothetical protein n=1 Tax=Actinokineospora pegani TaxID=2654637 RepID=UPI0012EAFABF|nr:hypothetical protein [Actinokineospora pegani]